MMRYGYVRVSAKDQNPERQFLAMQDMSNVKLTYNGETLTKDTDFTVSYLNNTKAGTAKIVFTGKGLYYGTLTKSFKITKAQLNDSMLDEESKNIEVTYTGKAVKPEITLKNGETTLKKGIDYTLTYKNNKKVSTDAAPAQIIVKGKGSYTGSFKVNFAIIAKSNGTDEKSNAKGVKPDEEDDNLTEDDAIVDEPTEDEPETDEPTTEETVTDEPTKEEPDTDEPTTDEPVADEPAEDEPVTDEPTEEEPAIDENGTKDTADTGSKDTDDTDDTIITGDTDDVDGTDEDDTDITDEEIITDDTESADIKVEAETEEAENIEESDNILEIPYD